MFNIVTRIIFTGRNEVVAKVMFLQVSVILSTGGGLRRTPPDQGEPPPDGEPPPRDGGTPPRWRPPGWRTPPGMENPPGWRTPPDGEPPRDGEPPPGSRHQHTVYERPVRILLECILVNICFLSTVGGFPCISMYYYKIYS